jgi:outer membrane protein OmpA-like peptidoglycan-associated protein
VAVSYNDGLKLDVLGDINIDNLLFKTTDKKKLLAWKALNINGINYIHNPMKLEIRDFQLDKPYIRAHIAKDGSTNFSGLIKEIKTEQKQEAKKQSQKKSALKIKIGPMKLTNGTSDFSDFSLPFPFQTHIHNLKGDLSTLDFETTTPSELSLVGQIDKYGYTDISGKLSPFNFRKSASLNLLFKNIDLTSLSPYSSKFVGYKIKQGKLSMDLKYSIDDDQLRGENKMNIDTLVLGEIVDSPDATSLPLELAIALLKDSDGQIDIDMPVKGNINDPDFSYGSVVWRAVGNMITGIVTAPFRILGNMLGVSEDELKTVDFDKGSSKIITTEHEKLDNLNKILAKRPAIKLNISGGYDEVFDKYELQKQKFKTIINKELRESKKDDDDAYGSALKNIYVKDFSIEQYDELKKSFTAKEDDNKTKSATAKPIGEIDTISFNNKMQKDITTNIKIKKQEFEKLANQRANSIKTELVEKYEIDTKRLSILPPKPQEAKRDRWIESELDIAI